MEGVEDAPKKARQSGRGVESGLEVRRGGVRHVCEFIGSEEKGGDEENGSGELRSEDVLRVGVDRIDSGVAIIGGSVDVAVGARRGAPSCASWKGAPGVGA